MQQEEYVNHKINTIGFHGAREKCGGQEVVATFLRRIRQSGEELLAQRGASGRANTTVILQHYPEHGWHTRRIFEDAAASKGRRTKVLGAWGHAHDQFCEGRDSAGNCDMVLTGGGGGCCLGNYGGFTAVHLTDDGGFKVDIESDEVRIPRDSCQV